MDLGSAARPPLFDGYFADPFALRVGDEYFAYGTGTGESDRVFEVLWSAALVTWESRGTCLNKVDAALGDAYWAPEVAELDGTFYMFFSVGHDIANHHIRVATATDPTGPFTDLGVNLTPNETFAIDPHPFRDDDGQWYLYFARDVLDDPRPGTHLAVARLDSMTALVSDVQPVLAPNDDWHIYERDRAMYGATYTWHTLEGPTVVKRNGTYWLTYSGGSWEGSGYGVSWARAESPLGPWEHAPVGSARILESTAELVGPGHSSLTTAPDGGDVIVFHAWNSDVTARQLHANRISFDGDAPALGSPL